MLMLYQMEKTLSDWEIGDVVQWPDNGLGIIVGMNHYMVYVWWAIDQRIWPLTHAAFKIHAKRPQ